MGGPHPALELTAVASSGTTFLANRASSSLANAVIASMLTGLPPRVLALDNPDARLPDGPTTVEEACRQGGVATAMFTANPTTGASFGFSRGWDDFEAIDPVASTPATQVFDDAATWIDAHKAAPFFVVVHARGGHPPWDATADDLKTMVPDGYLGIVEPRRAAEALAKVRKHPARFKEDDRARAWALYDRAIDAHDAAFGRLMAALRTAGRQDDTAIFVTSDVAANEGPPVPFAEPDTLDEPLLETPLVVRWPHADSLAGRRVEAPTSPVDLGRTILGALGLPPPSAFQGVDLARRRGGRRASRAPAARDPRRALLLALGVVRAHRSEAARDADVQSVARLGVHRRRSGHVAHRSRGDAALGGDGADARSLGRRGARARPARRAHDGVARALGPAARRRARGDRRALTPRGVGGGPMPRASRARRGAP